MKLAERIRQQPQWLIVAEALLLVLAVGIIDHISGYDLTIFILYAGPILFASWFIDEKTLRSSALVAAACAVAWFLSDTATGHHLKPTPIVLGNAFLQLGFLGFVVVSSSALRLQLKHSRAQVAEFKRFHILAELAPIGIFRTDAEGKCLYANHLWCHATGLPAAQVLEKRWAETLHPDDRRRVKSAWNRQKEGLFTFQARLLKPDHSTAWVLGQIAPERNGHGTITGYVGAVADMTEQREMEQQILDISEREQQRIGQDLHDDLCQFLAAIQYAASSLRSDLKRRKAPESADAGEVADLLKEAITRTRGLARRIFPVQLEEMGLLSALHELTSTTSRFYGICCTFEYEPPLFVDDNTAATHIFRIAQEALNNAIRHGQAQNITIALSMREETSQSLEEKSDDRLYTLTVTDDGCGLPPAKRETEKESERPRSGMGLRIMEYRSHMIGGTLKIASPAPSGPSSTSGTPGTVGTQVTCSFRLGQPNALLSLSIVS